MEYIQYILFYDVKIFINSSLVGFDIVVDSEVRKTKMKLLLSEHSGRLGCFIFLSRILLTLSVDTGGINVGKGSANNGEIRESL